MHWLLQGDQFHHAIMTFSILSGLNITLFQKLWNLFLKKSVKQGYLNTYVALASRILVTAPNHSRIEV